MTGELSRSNIRKPEPRLPDAESVDLLSDRDLMERFSRTGDETAFEALVGRHGPMVLRVCLQILGAPHDAQDAFQATFLVLACRAGSMRRYDSAASWLYGVALRVARSSRKMRARRRIHENRFAESKPVEFVGEADPSESIDDLHEEIGSLPEKLRLPVVLCYLEGMTAEAVAERLGCPRGTVLSRLAAAKERLRRRLTRRGIALPAGLLTAGISPVPVEASIPATLAQSVVHSATQIASGNAVATAATSEITSLAVQAMKSMIVGHILEVGSLVFLTLGGVAAATFLTVGLMGKGAAGPAPQSDQDARLAAVLEQWKSSAEQLGGSIRIRMTERHFLEAVPEPGGRPLAGRPSMRDRSRVERPQFRKRATPLVERYLVMHELSGDRFRARRYRRDADFPSSPDNAEAWDGQTWMVRESNYGSDLGVIGKRPDSNNWFKAYGLPYACIFRDVDYGFSYFEMIRQRRCTVEDDGRLLKIHAPEGAGVSLDQTYFTFWLDPARGMLPVRLERGFSGKPFIAGVDVTLEEIKPGVWAPMRYFAKSYDRDERNPTHGIVYAESDHVVEKANSRFGVTFDASTFSLTFPEGLSVIHR